MMMRKATWSGRCILLITIMVLVTGWTTAHAKYPERPITLIVSYYKGGATDAIAQIIAPYIAKYLGTEEKVVVEHRLGDNGRIGFAAIAEAPPDGYTIGFISIPSFPTLPGMGNGRLSLEDVDPLTNIVEDPVVFAVAENSSIKTLDDLMQAALKRPGMTFASTGVGSDDHVALAMLFRLNGVRLSQVPFPGGRIAHQALLSNKVDVCGENLAEALRYSQNDPVRILGVMSERRWPTAPHVPTFTELGYPIVVSTLRGIVAPPKIPADIRSKLVNAIMSATSDPEFIAQASSANNYQSLKILGPEQYRDELRRLSKEYSQAINDFSME